MKSRKKIGIMKKRNITIKKIIQEITIIIKIKMMMEKQILNQIITIVIIDKIIIIIIMNIKRKNLKEVEVEIIIIITKRKND